MLEQIGRYQVKEQIGRGGHATVYLGHDTVLNRLVAIKVMHQSISLNQKYLDSVKTEASTASFLKHKNTVEIYDFLISNDNACIVMEYLPNSLDKEIANLSQITLERAIEIITAVCEALSHAHEIGFVHRDIKPHNILLTADGTPKVSDFGLSRAKDLSVATSSIGTPLYMSPEQMYGE